MESYKGFEVKAIYNEKEKFHLFAIYKDGKFIQKDWNTLSGDKLQSDKQAINEAKKTIDAWIRLKLV